MQSIIAGVAAAILLSVTAFAQEIASQLPILAPRAVAWAESAQADGLAQGTALSPRVRALARSVGVFDPSRVRVVVVDQMPLPNEPMLRQAAAAMGLSQDNVTGLTLGYAIFVRRGHQRDPLLLSHELRHVAQYEAAGGIAPFLARHLVDLVQYGYEDSPYEVDARAHEHARLPSSAS
jgi:hypothetical protein